MAFLSFAKLNIDEPSRPAPTKPGSVKMKIRTELIVERLDRCFAALCPDTANDPMFQVEAEIWGADRKDEPPGTIPLPLGDKKLFQWFWQPSANASGGWARKVKAGELAQASPASGSSNSFLLVLEDETTVAESWLNEDWGPFPPPGFPPSDQTRDEIFLRVYLSSIFSNWQRIQTIDSRIVTGQFFGP
jgi:hypothetical protein